MLTAILTILGIVLGGIIILILAGVIGLIVTLLVGATSAFVDFLVFLLSGGAFVILIGVLAYHIAKKAWKGGSN